MLRGLAQSVLTSMRAASMLAAARARLAGPHDRGFVGDVQRPMIEGMDIIRAQDLDELAAELAAGLGDDDSQGYLGMAPLGKPW